MIKKETWLFELFSCSPPLPPPLLAADAGGVWVSEYLGVSERLLSSCRLWQCLSFWKAHFPCLSCLQFKPFDVFPRAEPNALDPLPSMLMFSDWLMNLLINPLVCAPQHCPLWNGIRGGKRRTPSQQNDTLSVGISKSVAVCAGVIAGLRWSATYFCEKSSPWIEKYSALYTSGSGD